MTSNSKCSLIHIDVFQSFYCCPTTYSNALLVRWYAAASRRFDIIRWRSYYRLCWFHFWSRYPAVCSAGRASAVGQGVASAGATATETTTRRKRRPLPAASDNRVVVIRATTTYVRIGRQRHEPYTARIASAERGNVKRCRMQYNNVILECAFCRASVVRRKKTSAKYLLSCVAANRQGSIKWYWHAASTGAELHRRRFRLADNAWLPRRTFGEFNSPGIVVCGPVTRSSSLPAVCHIVKRSMEVKVYQRCPHRTFK